MQRITLAELSHLPQNGEYDIDELEKLISVSGFLGSPAFVWNACLIRQAQYRLMGGDQVTPCDVYCLALGEPEQPWMTKIGGRPFLNELREWPLRSDGVHYTFLVQFDFEVSGDLLLNLPGEVLLVFSKDAALAYGDSDELAFVWKNRRGSSFAEPRESASLGKSVDCCVYGIACRTFDFQSQEKARTSFLELWSALPDSTTGGYPFAYYASLCSRFSGLKIGGAPSWRDLQIPKEWGNRYLPSESDFSSLRFLCGMGCVEPSERSWPFLNQERPLRALTSQNSLRWAEGFQINFFLDPLGKVRWCMEYR